MFQEFGKKLLKILLDEEELILFREK